MGFSQQEYQSGLSCPFPRDLPDGMSQYIVENSMVFERREEAAGRSLLLHMLQGQGFWETNMQEEEEFRQQYDLHFMLR